MFDRAIKFLVYEFLPFPYLVIDNHILGIVLNIIWILVWLMPICASCLILRFLSWITKDILHRDM